MSSSQYKLYINMLLLNIICFVLLSQIKARKGVGRKIKKKEEEIILIIIVLDNYPFLFIKKKIIIIIIIELKLLENEKLLFIMLFGAQGMRTYYLCLVHHIP